MITQSHINAHRQLDANTIHCIKRDISKYGVVGTRRFYRRKAAKAQDYHVRSTFEAMRLAVSVIEAEQINREQKKHDAPMHADVHTRA